MDSKVKLLKNAFVTLAASFAVAVVLALPGQASAADYENVLPQGLLTSPFSMPIGDSIAGTPGQTFLDHFTFNLTPDSSFNSIVAEFDLGSVFGISGLGVNLYTGGGALVQSGSSLGSIAIVSAPSIAAGIYDLRVNGTLTGSAGGTYGGTISAAPIPEPETYAMMLAGLGLMGFAARRRKHREVA